MAWGTLFQYIVTFPSPFVELCEKFTREVNPTGTNAPKVKLVELPPVFPYISEHSTFHLKNPSAVVFTDEKLFITFLVGEFTVWFECQTPVQFPYKEQVEILLVSLTL